MENTENNDDYSADQMNSCTVFRIICARHVAVKSPFWMNEVTHENTTSESSMTSCKQLTGDPHEEWFKSEWKHLWMRSVGIVAEDLTLCVNRSTYSKETRGGFSLWQARTFLEGWSWSSVEYLNDCHWRFLSATGLNPVSPFCEIGHSRKRSWFSWVKHPNRPKLSLLTLTTTF